MAATNIHNIIQPEIFTAYVIERTMALSSLIQSGIIVNTSEFDALASGANTLVNMPYWEDLTGDSEVIDTDNYLDPDNINANMDVARKHGRSKMWGVNNLSALLSGDDPMLAIANLSASFWNREMQKIMLSTVDGIFKSTSMQSKVHDISALADDKALISGESFIDAGQKMGDAKDLLTGIMMHSAVEAYLAKRSLIDYVQESEQSERVAYFMRKRVHVDDSMPFNTATKTATAYLFGSGAIALGNGKHPNILEVETARDSGSAAGEDFLINRKIFILHPRGVKWTEESVTKAFPSNEEIASGENWKRVFEPKKIRIVKFTFKID